MRLCSRAHAFQVHRWPEASRLFLVGDGAGWSLDEDMKVLAWTAAQVGVTVGKPSDFDVASRQAVFYASSCSLETEAWRTHTHRVGLAYWHGQPGRGEQSFDKAYDELRRHHNRIDRIQVSHAAMRDVVLASGIEPKKVFVIPLGVNLDIFMRQTVASRTTTRRRYGIAQPAFVVGSFQKDGVGWQDGAEAKLIKGPDVFLACLAALKPSVPELHVLLSGPARGYVKAGLARLGIPFTHVMAGNLAEVGALYQALDLYIVASREEGGPKAILESMASGVPLVTTRVGQAQDLVRHTENAWMVDVEDVEGLAHWAQQIHQRKGGVELVAQAARKTAEAHSYEKLVPRWRAFMDGFVTQHIPNH